MRFFLSFDNCVLISAVFHSIQTAGALCLNLRSSGQLLAIGDAADFGYCAAYKNEPGSTHHKGMVKCKQVVNLSKSPYCDYHVKSAYNSVKSKRMNLNQAR